jgi:hypothetical protein
MKKDIVIEMDEAEREFIDRVLAHVEFADSSKKAILSELLTLAWTAGVQFAAQRIAQIVNEA